VSGGFEIRAFGPGGGDMAAFESVRERVPRAAAALAPEPVSGAATCLLACRGDEPVARCTLLVCDGLHGAPGRSGLIGHYEALEADAGTALLVHARQALAGQDVARVLGPMNGSTWARYRLALPPLPGDPQFERPPFLTEPHNPPGYPAHFERAGFSVAARYESRIDRTLQTTVPPGAAIEERLRALGIAIRPLDLPRFDAELADIFEVSLVAFAASPYYTPLDFTTFREMYDPVRPLIDPGFVLMARNAAGRLVGFQLAFPDPLSAEDGRPRRIIVKTIATVPDARGTGLGNHMFDRIHQLARERGYRGVIHALMHVTNSSMRMSGRYGTEIFRRYALYEWTP
jgi:GNAT superfamily N-acetyltransferase